MYSRYYQHYQVHSILAVTGMFLGSCYQKVVGLITKTVNNTTEAPSPTLLPHTQCGTEMKPGELEHH